MRGSEGLMVYLAIASGIGIDPTLQRDGTDFIA